MNDEYPQALARRTRRIGHYLGLMDARTHLLARSSCYLIIHERDDRSSGQRRLRRKRPARAPAAAHALMAVPGAPARANAPWGGDHHEDDQPGSFDRTRRFVQWCFLPEFFALSLPNTTLSPAEGQLLTQVGSGFHYEADNPALRISGPEDTRRWNPLAKGYLYGDEQQAAADAAWILFSIWKLAIGTTLYVKASSFWTRHRWENCVPLE